METISLQKGQYLAHCGDEMKQIFIIVRGSIRMESSNDRYLIENGNIIGLLECSAMAYSCDYYAEENTVIAAYSYQTVDDFKQIFEENADYAYAFVHSAIIECGQLLERYITLNSWVRTHEGTPSEEIEAWEILYYRSLQKKDTNLLAEIYGKDNNLCIGELMRMSEFMLRVTQGIHEMLDSIECSLGEIFGEEPIKTAGEDESGSKPVTEKGNETEKSGEAGNITAEEQEKEESEEESGVDCLELILAYAGLEPEDMKIVRSKIEKFKQLPDIYSTDDDVRLLRRELTKIFFQVYEKAFFRSMEELEPVDEILQMFFNFGFMDVQLVGEENADELYDMTVQLERCNNGQVHTIYRWLTEVYEGLKTPSKNEFDMDFPQYLREQLKGGQITKEQMNEALMDRKARVRFEIHNMFASTNRATYGQYASYCPILRREDLTGPLQTLLVTAVRVDKALQHVREIDYSCFYREMYVADSDHNLAKQQIRYEMLPDVILMPNAGCKAMMWQEAGGPRGEAAARFMLPIFTTANVDDLILECCGRYRWEMCRRTQGIHWNDIRESSLTAEYCDYLQFYRKNHNLSADAREKIKSAIAKAKNNYREVFVVDYIAWVKYEAQGSVRLNKQARDIIFRYCPLARPIRESLKESPMYRDMIGKFEILNDREAKKVQSALARYQKSGGELLPEMEEYLAFFEK